MTSDQRDAQTAEIARLMNVADDEDAAGVAAIRRVHAAKTGLRAFSPSELRGALDLWRKRLQESVS